jgi:hypothetical protein
MQDHYPELKEAYDKEHPLLTTVSSERTSEDTESQMAPAKRTATRPPTTNSTHTPAKFTPRTPTQSTSRISTQSTPPTAREWQFHNMY